MAWLLGLTGETQVEVLTRMSAVGIPQFSHPPLSLVSLEVRLRSPVPRRFVH